MPDRFFVSLAIWTGCIATLQEPAILTHPLAEGIVVTLYAIADVYSRRLEGAKKLARNIYGFTYGIRGNGNFQ